MSRENTPSHIQLRSGITIAETVISMLLISLVLVGTIQLVAPLARSSTVMADKLVAANLASELSEEIASKYWTSPLLFERDTIGAADGETRSTYDDIDDYHGWSSSPPTLSSGNANFALTGWTRSVKVTHVELGDAITESATATGLKRVTVTVQKDGRTLSQLSTLHSEAADFYGFIVPPGSGTFTVVEVK